MIKKVYNRILEISPDSQQITVLDGRVYRRNGKYYPSISTILQSFPKGRHYDDWLKRHGYNADYIVDQAAKDGTAVHNLIERYLDGEQLNYLDQNGNPTMHPDIWQMFLHFVEFWTKYKPTLIEKELLLFSDEMEIAGTTDMVCEIELNGVVERWIIDHKTSNSLHTSQELQTAAYQKCYEECYGIPIDRRGILWLKSSSRKEDPTGKKIKGKGWELAESDRTYEEDLTIFKHVYEIFKIENPKFKPVEEQFEISVKLEQ